MSVTELNLTTQAMDGTLRPSKISTNPADDFTFPNNVIANARLVSSFLTPSVGDTSYLNLIHNQLQVVLSGAGYMTIGGAGTDLGGTTLSTGSTSVTNNHVTTNSLFSTQILALLDTTAVIDVTNRRLYDTSHVL